jgi:3-hydroxyacyl-[acyl-carrier-protein] dehydratase
VKGEKNVRAGIPADHPCLAGHFPGNPIVPGVIILEEVIAAVESWRPGRTVAAISMVKFHCPLKPDTAFSIGLTEKNGRCKFACLTGGRALATGELLLT